MKLKVPWQETILSKGEDKTRQDRKGFLILSFTYFCIGKEIKENNKIQ